MHTRPLGAARSAGVALFAAASIALAGVGLVAAGPAGASHKKHHSTSSGTAQAKTLKTLSAKIKKAKKATYSATFAWKTTSGKTQTIKVAQAPPKSFYQETATTSFVDTGTASYVCSKTETGSAATSSSTSSTSATGATGATTTTTTTTAPKTTVVCIKEAAADSPLAGFLDLFSATTIVTEFNAAESSIDEHILGYSVKVTSQTIAGQASKCVTVKVSGVGYKYCVTSNGLLAYSGTGKEYFELKSFSKSAPASDFQVPSGAKIETVP